MRKLKTRLSILMMAMLIAFAAHAGPFTVIGTVNSVPADNTTPAGAVELKSINTIEISGRVTGGSGVLHVLRKVQMSPTSYQFRPWVEDRPIDPFERQDTDGYFSTRISLPQGSPVETFIIYNPSGTVTIDATKPLVIRGVTY